jgi:catechol 2,3-dioxygenase-like lactoylglutathione lyase family enzyme
MSRIRPRKFVHVVYRTRRFEQMLAWYQVVFDARIQYQNPALAFLTYDDEHHRFAFANLEVLQPGGAGNDQRGMIGVEYDPEDWLARIRAGAPLSEFLVRRVHEPMSPIRGALGAA